MLTNVNEKTSIQNLNQIKYFITLAVLYNNAKGETSFKKNSSLNQSRPCNNFFQRNEAAVTSGRQRCVR